MPTTLDCLLMRDLFGTPQMRAIFDSSRLVQSWLDAEAALARAEAEVGIFPAQAAAAIERACDVGRYDLDALREGIAASQHPLVPLVRALVEQAGEGARWVHWGATTQDIIDTGLVLQLRDALDLLLGDLDRSLEACAALAERFADTPMAGRTHGQHAVPITFGLKVASWADELLAARASTAGARAQLPAQLGGAAGSLAALGDDAPAVLAAFCRTLDLREPAAPWHSARHPLRRVGHALRDVGAVGERIAGEIVRLQSTEVAELTEPAMPGHVGSSTMPQKRNPMTSEYLIASARALRATVSALDDGAAHAGERDMGPWAVEWLALPQGCILAAGVLDKLAWALEGLEVDAACMAANLDITGGAIMAEAVMMRAGRRMGHEVAHTAVLRAARQAQGSDVSFRAALAEHGIAPDEIEAGLDPAAYLGWSGDVARALARAARDRP
jgi:adenylosuccinate lyase/3-carboxy-cis,cis-muconate cycloisomerase